MTEALASFRGRLAVGDRVAVPTMLAVLGCIALVVVLSTRAALLVQVTAVAIVLVALVLGLRWPLLLLFAFAALIPIEEVVTLSDFGTLSRIAGLLFAVAYGLPRLGQLTFRAMPLPAWAFVGWAVLSVGWALDQGAALAELPTLIQLFVVAVLVADVVVHSPSVVHPLLWAYTLSATVAALVGIVPLLAGAVAPGLRIAAFPGQDEAQFAAVLLPALVFSLSELLNRRHLLLSGAVAVACTAGVVLSGTRGAWVSMTVVAVLFFLPRLSSRQRIAAVLVTALLVGGAVQLPGAAALVTQRADVALSSGGSGRVDIWSVGIAIFESAPVAGVGFANFPVAFTMDRIVASAATADPGISRAPHNIIIGTLGELGLVGFILLVLFLLPLVARGGWGSDAAVVQAALASLMTAALFLDILSNRKQVWLLIGIAAGLAYLRRHDGIPLGQRPAVPAGTTVASHSGR
ncbi:MAG: O-antigen ligase family protein [Isosphaeraceae bacterium]|nr:O-antigen ligase family protein [Isosphaeraceae bacterium]